MEEADNSASKKKSQKRKDRQERKAERRRSKAERLLGISSTTIKKPKARLSKKSLPGFLAKNADMIVQWLKDYRLLFMMADDYNIDNFIRMKPENRQTLVQNYVDVSEFISVVQEIKREAEEKRIAELSAAGLSAEAQKDASAVSDEYAKCYQTALSSEEILEKLYDEDPSVYQLSCN